MNCMYKTDLLCTHALSAAPFLAKSRNPTGKKKKTIPVTLAEKFILPFQAWHVGQVTMASAEILQCLFIIPPQMTG